MGFEWMPILVNVHKAIKPMINIVDVNSEYNNYYAIIKSSLLLYKSNDF